MRVTLCMSLPPMTSGERLPARDLAIFVGGDSCGGLFLYSAVSPAVAVFLAWLAWLPCGTPVHGNDPDRPRPIGPFP